jgi:adenine specific DNA methylase Mod
LLDYTGANFVTINDIETHRLRFLIDKNFGDENFIGNIVWQKKQSPQNDAINFSDMHDHILVHAKYKKQSRNDTRGWQRDLIPRTTEQIERYSNPDNDARGDWASGDLTSNKTYEERPNLYFPIINPNNNEEIFPPKSRVWRFEKDLLNKLIMDNQIWWGEDGNNFPRQKKFISDVAEGIVPTTWWSREFAGDNQSARRELRSLFKEEVFGNITPKPTKLIKNIINISGRINSYNLDYFAGSGTTAHAVMNLNREDGGSRKYILVEMGDHFYDVILPRIKKVAFNSKWKDGKPVFEEDESGVSHFVKYYELEQYEEVLQKVHYEDADLFDDPNQDPYHSYVFLRDLKLLDSLEVDPEKDQVKFHPERLYPDIDLAETLSHLRGKCIKRITEDTVEFEDGERMSLTDPDWETLKPMIWWQ